MKVFGYVDVFCKVFLKDSNGVEFVAAFHYDSDFGSEVNQTFFDSLEKCVKSYYEEAFVEKYTVLSVESISKEEYEMFMGRYAKIKEQNWESRKTL